MHPLTADGYPDCAAAVNEIAGREVTTGNNAAVLLWQAFGPRHLVEEVRPQFFRLLGIGPPAEQGDYLVSFARYLQDASRPAFTAESEHVQWSARAVAQYERASKEPWSKADFPLVAEWLEANEKPLRLIVEASRRPRYFSPIIAQGDQTLCDAILAPSFTPLMDAVRLLSARAMLRIAEGKHAKAWEDLLTCHRLVRLVSQGPFLVDQAIASGLDTTACRATASLSHHPGIDSARFRAALTDLQSLPSWARLDVKWDVGERIFNVDWICAVAQDRPNALRLLGMMTDQARLDAYRELSSDPRVNWDQVLRIRHADIDRLVAISRLPTPTERHEAISKRNAEVAEVCRTATEDERRKKSRAKESSSEIVTRHVADLLEPNDCFPGLMDFRDRAEVRFQLTQFALALAAARAEHGQYPAALVDLAPVYLPVIPKDVFSAEDFRYHRQREGYLLYSVGPNGKDEAGRNAADPDAAGKYDKETDPGKIPDDIAVRTPEKN